MATNKDTMAPTVIIAITVIMVVAGAVAYLAIALTESIGIHLTMITIVALTFAFWRWISHSNK
jgi:hypothetical protein